MILGAKPPALDLEAAQRRYRQALKTAYGTAPKVCENVTCQRTEGVELEPSRTAYHWDGKGVDPNAPIWLCRECAKEHHEHWDGMWADYYSGLM